MALAPASPPSLTIDALGIDVLRPTRRWEFARFLLRRRIALLCVIFLSVFYLCGIFAPLIAPYNPNQQTLSLEARRAAPSSDHLFGTDALGRDLLSRVFFSARTTIIFTVLVIVSGEFVIGLGLGLLAGYRGGWIDTAIMRVGECQGVRVLHLLLRSHL